MFPKDPVVFRDRSIRSTEAVRFLACGHVNVPMQREIAVQGSRPGFCSTRNEEVRKALHRLNHFPLSPFMPGRSRTRRSLCRILIRMAIVIRGAFRRCALRGSKVSPDGRACKLEQGVLWHPRCRRRVTAGLAKRQPAATKWLAAAGFHQLDEAGYFNRTCRWYPAHIPSTPSC
jgi:hypothetical protein